MTPVPPLAEADVATELRAARQQLLPAESARYALLSAERGRHHDGRPVSRPPGHHGIRAGFGAGCPGGGRRRGAAGTAVQRQLPQRRSGTPWPPTRPWAAAPWRWSAPAATAWLPTSPAGSGSTPALPGSATPRRASRQWRPTFSMPRFPAPGWTGSSPRSRPPTPGTASARTSGNSTTRAARPVTPGRDPRVTAAVTDTVVLDQAFTWNPSGPGVKIEDTVQLTESGLRVLTVDPRWPSTTVNGLDRPVTLQLYGSRTRVNARAPDGGPGPVFTSYDAGVVTAAPVRPSTRRGMPSGLSSRRAGCSTAFRGVLVGHRALEAADRRRTHRGEQRRGGRVRAAVLLRPVHGDARGPAIEQDAAGQAGELLHQRRDVLTGLGVHGAGQAARNLGQDSRQFLLVRVFDEHGGGAEALLQQLLRALQDLGGRGGRTPPAPPRWPRRPDPRCRLPPPRPPRRRSCAGRPGRPRRCGWSACPRRACPCWPLPRWAAKDVPAGMNTRPGLVQNWPAPRVKEPGQARRRAAAERACSAAAVMTTGLRLPSSP